MSEREICKPCEQMEDAHMDVCMDHARMEHARMEHTCMEDAHMEDAHMEHACAAMANDRFPAAMAYVRWQKLEQMYRPELALARGTLFPELDKPFCGRTVTGGKR